MPQLYDVLDPYIGPGKSFKIQPDGRSQTELSNKGRFGFWVESQFNILPNKDQAPDLNGIELKSVMLKGDANRPVFKHMAIGNISRTEFDQMQKGTLQFSKSTPNRKARNTLTVFYNRTDDYSYSILKQMYVRFADQSESMMDELKRDFDLLCKHARSTSYESLGSVPAPATRYLSIKRKGDCYYTYPCWHFTVAWTRAVYNAKSSN